MMAVKRFAGMLAVAMMAGVLGCRQEPPVSFESNLVHSYKYHLTRDLPMDQVVEDTEWALTQLFGTPNEPKIPDFISDSPDFANFLSLERLKIAAGPDVADEEGMLVSGLFRGHCSNCHGVTGTGRGPAAVGVVPYPRDYRMGVFKFKSTTRGAKPTREDLAKLIRHGIGGTAMNPIPGMTESQVQTLVEYVIYLSWRGEVERQMIDSAMFDLDLAAGDRIINPDSQELMDEEIIELTNEESEILSSFEEDLDQAYEVEIDERIKSDVATITDEEKDALLAKFGEDLEEDQLSLLEKTSVNKLKPEQLEPLLRLKYENLSELAKLEIRDVVAERDGSLVQVELRARQQKIDRKARFEENWGYIKESVEEIAGSWLDAEDEVTELEPPGDIPVPQSRAEFVAMLAGEQADALKSSIERGRALFTSELVGCAKCHGKEGKGDGQTTDYDDWTKDWTTSVGLDPKDSKALIPLRARGAWEPQNIKPRNFAEGIFRGGSHPDDLYRRIANGIAGTPMPAATMVEGQFALQDIWHLVNFVRSLDQSEPTADEPATAKPQMTDAVMLGF